MEAGEIFGWIATFLSICFYISPITMFIQVIKNKMEYKNTPFIIILTNLFNSLIWFLYGYAANNYQIIICNFSGNIASLICLSIYFIYMTKDVGIKGVLLFIITLIASFILACALKTIDNNNLNGILANIANIIAFSSPGVILYKVFKTSNYLLIPINTALVNIFATSCWITFGIGNKDFFIVFPNLIGLIFGFIQVFTYFSLKKNDEKLPKKIEVDNYPIKEDNESQSSK